jgi:hypothetical protein
MAKTDKPVSERGPKDSPFTDSSTQDAFDAMNERDERKPDWRPATPVRIGPDGLQIAEDNREPPPDLGRSLNQMSGRAVVTEAIMKPALADRVAPVTDSPAVDGKDATVVLKRGYQQAEGQRKWQAGETIKVTNKEARHLVNLGAAMFPED